MNLQKLPKNDLELENLNSISFKLQLKYYLVLNCNLLCDIFTGTPRALVSNSFHRLIYEYLNKLVLADITATTKLICSRYARWPNMKQDIKNWGRCCEVCQDQNYKDTQKHVLTRSLFLMNVFHKFA